MKVEVCTIWAPRPDHPKWRADYVDLLAMQRDTAARYGHRHLVVSDADLPGFEVLTTKLPASLMQAMICGVIARLIRPVETHIVFVDCDVLIARDLSEAFDGTFDLGLTRRENLLAPVNNGAMYLAKGAEEAALPFFCNAARLCGDHWGGDQEAISQAAAPVPDHECVETRDGLRIGFLSMRTHNVIPKTEGKRHDSNPFVVHFKGSTKPWARTYAEKFILGPDDGTR